MPKDNTVILRKKNKRMTISKYKDNKHYLSLTTLTDQPNKFAVVQEIVRNKRTISLCISDEGIDDLITLLKAYKQRILC